MSNQIKDAAGDFVAGERVRSVPFPEDYAGTVRKTLYGKTIVIIDLDGGGQIYLPAAEVEREPRAQPIMRPAMPDGWSSFFSGLSNDPIRMDKAELLASGNPNSGVDCEE